jgi:hypothetical protein
MRGMRAKNKSGSDDTFLKRCERLEVRGRFKKIQMRHRTGKYFKHLLRLYSESLSCRSITNVILHFQSCLL